MKKHLLFILGILVTGGLSAQSVPDSNFENWSTLTWNEPQYYHTANEDIASKGGTTFNVTEATGYLGVNYGVQLQTISLSGAAQAAYMIDANVQGNGVQGGIPYSQQPTGIRFYYKYAPATNDTAAVLVIFKKWNGSTETLLDSFEIAITGTTSVYTLRSYMKTLPAAPDTVVFGAISSLGGISGSGGHVGSILTIDSVTFTGVTSQPAELNGDFQNWTTTNTMVPIPGWYTNEGVTQTTDAQTGKYALEVSTINFNGNIIDGNASTGYYPKCKASCNEQGGQPYTTMIDTLWFAYKYAPTKGDTGYIGLYFIKNGMQFYSTGISLTKTVTTYQDTMIAFNTGTAPDTVIVTVQSSSHNHDTSSIQSAPYVGTVLRVDNMAFKSQGGGPTSVKTIVADGGIRIYPNPSNGLLNIDMSRVSGSVSSIKLYDMSGRLVSSQNYNGQKNTITTIDMTSFSNGMYLLETVTNSGNFYQKVSKQ